MVTRDPRRAAHDLHSWPRGHPRERPARDTTEHRLVGQVAVGLRAAVRALLVLLLGLAAPCRLDAQQGGASGQGVRVEWTANPAKNAWQALCGYIYNDGPLARRDVQLAIEGFDASDRVLTTSSASVLGYISPFGRTYFCSTVPAGAARYSVKVRGVEQGSDR